MLEIDDGGVEAVYRLSQGDMRRVVNMLQVIIAINVVSFND